ncbi:MAG: phosphodiester glycosidase family protein [Candidatus Margulisiibacteriota bacterium]
MSLVIALVLCGACPAFDKVFTRRLDEGVDYTHIVRTMPSGQILSIHAVKLDLASGSFEVFPALARETVGRLESVDSIAKRYGALVAVNGSFFKRSRPYLPLGLLVINGSVITKSLLNRSAVGISNDKEVKFGIPRFVGKIINKETGEELEIWGMNRPRKEHEIIIYTPEYGASTRTNENGVELIIEDDRVFGISSGNSPIPDNGYVISFHGWTRDYSNTLPPGANVEARYSLSEGWESIDHVITAGPRLVENSANVSGACVRDEYCGSDLIGRNARSAIGMTLDNKLLIVVSEGNSARRNKRRKGLTYHELAETLIVLGAKDAIALDGGSSSTLFLKDRVVNIPSDGFQQGVSNALLVKLGKR